MIVVFYGLIFGILAFSIYRIRKYSKMLVQNKIFASECLMICHLASFAFLAITESLDKSVAFSISLRSAGGSYDTTDYRLYYMELLVSYLVIIAFDLVIATMVVMFLKHSKPLSRSTKVSITERFMLVFSDSNMLSEINEERLSKHSD